MNSTSLKKYLDIYLAVRSATGFKDHAIRILLRDFVAYLIANKSYESIRARDAVNWACDASLTRGVSGKSNRLSVARGFLTYLQASEPEVEIPDKYILASAKRRKPYIFSSQEIIDLLQAASTIRPRDTLRPYTYTAILGLMASTGLRVSEVTKLTVSDVNFNSHPPKIFIMEAKCYKSRIVPLHPSTGTKLQQYKKMRTKMGYAGLSDAFFVSEKVSDHYKPSSFHRPFS